MTLDQFHKNLLAIDPWEVLRPILESHFDFLIELVKKQLSEGFDQTGAMPDYASDVYAHMKEKYVETYNIYPTVDLRVTGDFYQGMKAQFNLMGISIESLDSKAKKLEKKYGSEIYVPNKVNMELFISQIIDEFRTALFNAMAK